MKALRAGAPHRGAPRRGAIIGFGNVAANGHLPGWRARSDVRIVAVSDPDAQRRAAAAALLDGVRTYASAEELLRHERLDFVDIAAPPALHAPLMVAAANAGVHVLCEKPLTTAWRDYLPVRAAAHRAGVVVYTVHNWKYSEAFAAVRPLVTDGTVGTLRQITFVTERDGCAAATGDNWRVQPALAGGGILVDHGWHAFYLMLALAARAPRRVRAVLERRRYTDVEVEDTAACMLDFGSLTSEVRLTWAAAARRTQWHLKGEAGEVLLDDDRLVIDGTRGPAERRLAASLSAGSHHPEWFNGVIDAFCRELDDPGTRGTNQREAEWCLVLLSLAYASGTQGGRWLEVPEPREWLAEAAA